MGYERYPRDSRLGDYYNRSDDADYARDYGSGRDFSYSSARQYQAAGAYDRDRDDRGYNDRNYVARDTGYGERDDNYGGRGHEYGPREYGYGRYAQRDRMNAGQQRYGSDYGRDNYGQDSGYYRGNEGTNRFGSSGQRYGGYGDDRGFFDRAGDEVRSWFGDNEAERRREQDARRDATYGSSARDDDYHNWRRGQISALDRDYDEYRSENRSKFENEFSNWRTERQGQRGLLPKVTEHMDVVGSDGGHVGTVDKVRGDRILLTKSDQDAGGRHHSIPSRWLQAVDDKVTLRKTADEAHSHWRDEERNQAMFGDDTGKSSDTNDTGGRMLNRSFSGTY